MSSLRPQPVLAPGGSHRKKPLTEAEKAQIWRFHKENPLVTHLDIASTFKQESSVQSWAHLDPTWHNPMADGDVTEQLSLGSREGKTSLKIDWLLELQLIESIAPFPKLFIRVTSKNSPLPKTMWPLHPRIPSNNQRSVLIHSAPYRTGLKTAIAQGYLSQGPWSESKRRYWQLPHGDRTTPPTSTIMWARANPDGGKIVNYQDHPQVRPRFSL